MSKDLDLSTAKWHTSTYSNGTGGDCVEVARDISGMHPVRDTKDRTGHVLTFSTATWATFLKHLK
ncbi:DUF397 domain-containing protein [Streptomyces sp. NPDC049879]|uniref:DUF397 domain-containing protein n=1 Tax=Streptomyces sp. NPDC049879 TaxID=3365598 RepID=UPI0037A899FA